LSFSSYYAVEEFSEILNVFTYQLKPNPHPTTPAETLKLISHNYAFYVRFVFNGDLTLPCIIGKLTNSSVIVTLGSKPDQVEAENYISRPKQSS